MNLTSIDTKDLEQELERRKLHQEYLDKQKVIWPKRLESYAHGSKFNENILEWMKEECGWDWHSPESGDLAYLNYTIELVYEVYQDGTVKLIECSNGTEKLKCLD